MPKDSVISSATDQSILVVGADGMIGRHLVAALELKGKQVWGSTRKKNQVAERQIFLDMAETICEGSLLPNKIGTAILCAAETSMERCRLDATATRRINVENTVALAKRLVDEGTFVIFLSSNTVFDGQVAVPKATDRTNPQTEYGRQKADAEERLLSLGGQVAVVRFSKIIPPDMPLITSWASDLSARKIIHPFSDSVMAPVSVTFAVELISRVLTHKRSGIIQASATGDMSYKDAAKYIALKLGVDIRLIEPISYLQAGIQFSPKYTTLDVTTLLELGFEAPSETHALDQLNISIVSESQ
ncbi:MAG: sugar nucleotide-binding protein [Rhodospirillales bacterium]|jgi:dTDP-4-dehydrorhamnose reductase|nr:sugar nucleotide-binding protein [Rhodospirillales bacterium]